MSKVSDLKRVFRSFLFPAKETSPKEAYDLWSGMYDLETNNLMLDLESAIFTELLRDVSLEGKIIADVGCGTGRHWPELYAQQPSKLYGFDVSEGMLNVLKRKFPEAETNVIPETGILPLPSGNFDMIVSTLALAHAENADNCFAEWTRILKRDGSIILTDYHPAALQAGGNRTFRHEGKSISVKNYVHSVEKIRDLQKKFRLRQECFIEKKIDESVKHYFERGKALDVYRKFNNHPIAYGMRLTRVHAAA